MVKRSRTVKKRCIHDYKNTIQIGNFDYICPLCKELINPLGWYLVNNLGAAFADVTLAKIKNDFPY